MASYPITIPDLVSLVIQGMPITSMSTIAAEIVAAMTTLGTNPQGASGTVANRIAAMENQLILANLTATGWQVGSARALWPTDTTKSIQLRSNDSFVQLGPPGARGRIMHLDGTAMTFMSHNMSWSGSAWVRDDTAQIAWSMFMQRDLMQWVHWDAAGTQLQLMQLNGVGALNVASSVNVPTCNVSGTLTANAANSNSASVTGALYAGSATVAGTLTAGTATMSGDANAAGNIAANGQIRAGQVVDGNVVLTPVGGTTYPGYLGFFRGATRQGYIGFMGGTGGTNNLQLVAEGGWNWEVVGTLNCSLAANTVGNAQVVNKSLWADSKVQDYSIAKNNIAVGHGIRTNHILQMAASTNISGAWTAIAAQLHTSTGGVHLICMDAMSYYGGATTNDVWVGCQVDGTWLYYRKCQVVQGSAGVVGMSHLPGFTIAAAIGAGVNRVISAWVSTSAGVAFTTPESGWFSVVEFN